MKKDRLAGKVQQVIMFLLCATEFACMPVFASIIRVPADQPTIQAGLDAAVRGATVLVADGIYSGEGNRDIS
jgi:hypothetical protein